MTEEIKCSEARGFAFEEYFERQTRQVVRGNEDRFRNTPGYQRRRVVIETVLVPKTRVVTVRRVKQTKNPRTS